MKIDKDFILNNRSSKGGWRFSQIVMLGETWPPRKGWIERSVGKEISEEAAQKFIQYGQERISKKERRALKKSTKKRKEHKVVIAQPTVSPFSKDDFLSTFEWRKVRMVALKKYGPRCQCCGATPADGLKMHVDHIKPRKLYPQLALDVSNLQILCEECNHGKGNWDMTDWRHLTEIMTEGK